MRQQLAEPGAALALLVRLTTMFGGLDPIVDSSQPMRGLPYKSVIAYMVPTLAFFAALTTTFGNLAAYMQTNLKRLLAYSTIAHAGFMLMGLCTLTRAGVEAVYQYLKSKNAKIVHPPEEGPWAPGYYSILFEDPDGIRLEVNHVPGKGIFEEGFAFNPSKDYI